MTNTESVISVIIIDDSALIRGLLANILESDPRLRVVAAAKDAFEARDLIKKYSPDVITLDVEMPKMNGITFLKNLMRLRPMPVVMISTLTHEGAPATLQALEYGAVDFVAKPNSDGASGLDEYRSRIIQKVVAAAGAKVCTYDDTLSAISANKLVTRNATRLSGKRLRPGFVCAIGASTGGTEAIKTVISALPKNSPPVVIVQHIPETFSASFAKRVDSLSAVKVYEAIDNQKIEPGCVYIAPGHSHMKIALLGGVYVCKLDRGEPINRHRPAVEKLFDSVVEATNKRCMSVMLTGMGSDGAEAMLRMRLAGCYTIAQDEDSCVVWGMPGAAVKLNAMTKQLPLSKIAGAILDESFH